uniref:Uncharacterized protein n=1 Tax=Zea mays TaxID=4577 RepID=C0PB71_MAIZE|nr:unknown [Zea mays]|eukprot:NP_001169016.1 uncharacterized protein LOC100382849 [Zea mays]
MVDAGPPRSSQAHATVDADLPRSSTAPAMVDTARPQSSPLHAMVDANSPRSCTCDAMVDADLPRSSTCDAMVDVDLPQTSIAPWVLTPSSTTTWIPSAGTTHLISPFGTRALEAAGIRETCHRGSKQPRRGPHHRGTAHLCDAAAGGSQESAKNQAR